MLAGSLPLFGNTLLWMTPIWILSLGVAAGLIVLLAIWGLLWLVARPLAREIPAMLREGPLVPVFYACVTLSALAILTTLLAQADLISLPYERLLASARRIPLVGTITREVELPAKTDAFVVDVDVPSEEVKSAEFKSEQDVRVGVVSDVEKAERAFVVQGQTPYLWVKGGKSERPFAGHVSQFTLTNDSVRPTHFSMTLVCDVEFPEVYWVPIAAAGVIGIFGLYFAFRILMPRAAAVANTAARQGASQPIFLLLMALGAFCLVAFIYIPYYTFGEDVKMLKGSGLELMMVLALLVALWTASVSIAEEIEGRTALTLLSKPLPRWQFIIGKFLGVVWPVLVMYVLLGIVLLAVVSYKVVYDAHESAKVDITWQNCFQEMVQTIPALVLGFLEVVILASISVAISTRAPMIPNLVICFSMYLLGNLAPMIVNSSATRFEIVKFVGLLIATVTPNLDVFNVQPAIAGGVFVPLTYLLMAALYAGVYCSIMMLVALFLFEDRDLA